MSAPTRHGFARSSSYLPKVRLREPRNPAYKKDRGWLHQPASTLEWSGLSVEFRSAPQKKPALTIARIRGRRRCHCSGPRGAEACHRGSCESIPVLLGERSCDRVVGTCHLRPSLRWETRIVRQSLPCAARFASRWSPE